jgi:hypothetical protein
MISRVSVKARMSVMTAVLPAVMAAAMMRPGVEIVAATGIGVSARGAYKKDEQNQSCFCYPRCRIHAHCLRSTTDP